MKALGKLKIDSFVDGDVYEISSKFVLDDSVDSDAFKKFFLFRFGLILGETFFNEELMEKKVLNDEVSFEDGTHIISDVRFKNGIAKVKLLVTDNPLYTFLKENDKQSKKTKKEFFIVPRISEYKEINGKRVISKISTFDIII